VNHYHLTVFFTATDETAAKAFVKEMEETGIAQTIRREAGCLRYDFYFDAKDPSVILLLEEWESEAHQKIHVNQPHMNEMRAVKAKYITATRLIPVS